MGQSTRSQGISFTHEMWSFIDHRCSELNCGRSKYFQMLVENDLRFLPEIYAHKSDGKWHFFPESAAGGAAGEALHAADSGGERADRKWAGAGGTADPKDPKSPGSSKAGRGKGR